MRDYSELKTDAQDQIDGHEVTCCPVTVLALIAGRDQLFGETEQLKAENKALSEFKADMVQMRELHGFDSWAAVLVELDRIKATAELAAKKLRSAEICHPRAVETLVGEAREALAAYLPAGWPESQVSS